MRVRCRSNLVADVSTCEKVRGELKKWFPHGRASLTPNAPYVVYGIMMEFLLNWYFVVDEAAGDCPRAFPSEFFDVLDDRLSRYWCFKRIDDKRDVNHGPRYAITLPEWIRDLSYYGNLVESDPIAKIEFAHMKELMDFEFPDPCITSTAELGDDEWLLCPNCYDAWQSRSTLGLVRCMKCQLILNNPRYLLD